MPQQRGHRTDPAHRPLGVSLETPDVKGTWSCLGFSAVSRSGLWLLSRADVAQGAERGRPSAAGWARSAGASTVRGWGGEGAGVWFF